MDNKKPSPFWSSSRSEVRPALSHGLLTLALAAALGLPLAHGAPRSGENVVADVCLNCHKDGKMGAPVMGDQKAWSQRKTQGLSKLTKNALEGIRNMPAHGGNAGLSGPELERAITYMVNRSGGNWVEPVEAAGKSPARTGEQLVKAKCAECHSIGKDGAPKIGDREAWTARVSKGLNEVVASGIHGRGAMPARGGMADLSDEEMRAAVVYMFTQSVAPKKP